MGMFRHEVPKVWSAMSIDKERSVSDQEPLGVYRYREEAKIFNLLVDRLKLRF